MTMACEQHETLITEPIISSAGDASPFDVVNDVSEKAIDVSVNAGNQVDALDTVSAKDNLYTQVNEEVHADDILDQIELFDRKLSDAEMQCSNNETELQMNQYYLGLRCNENEQTDAMDGTGGNCTATCHESNATDTTHGELPASKNTPLDSTSEIKFDEFPILDFPVAININERNTTGESSFFGRYNNHTERDSAAKNLIVRNKNLVGGKGLSKLTPDEEERVAKILREEDDAMENYIQPSDEEMTRETEIDLLLNDLGYFFETGDVSASANENSRGEPALRELAEKRYLEEREKSIDRALRALLREPLPRVIRLENAKNGEDSISVLSSIGNSLSAPISEDRIRELVQQVKLNLEEDNMRLADQNSVRLLASSLLNGELAKNSI
ncbi:hypothetical protein ACHAW6_012101 [Cyclotella cf. meneghiniana]